MSNTFTDSNCKLYYYIGKDADAYMRRPRMKGHCTEFEFLVDFPEDLARVITFANLPDADLTFAASAMYACHDWQLVIDTLLPLLDHPSAVVREGTILGIQRCITDEVRVQLQSLAEHDPSQGVRETAIDALTD